MAYVGKDKGKQTLSYSTGGSVNWHKLFEDQFGSLYQNLKYSFTQYVHVQEFILKKWMLINA